METTKNVRKWFKQQNTIITTTNIICGIVTVKLNHNITANLPIEQSCEIASFMYKFQHQLKFQPVLRDIEDGTMCVSQPLTFPMFLSDIYSLEHTYWRLETWLNMIYPPYDDLSNMKVHRYIFLRYSQF